MTAIRDRYNVAIQTFQSHQQSITDAFNDIVKQQLILDDPTKSVADKQKAADAITAAKNNIVTHSKSQKDALDNINQVLFDAAKLGVGDNWDMPKKPADDDSKWARIYTSEPNGGTDEWGQPTYDNVAHYVDAAGNILPDEAPESLRALDANYVTRLNAYNAEQDKLKNFGEVVTDGLEMVEDIQNNKGTSGIKDADVDPRLIVADFYSAQANLAKAQELMKKGKELIADGEKEGDKAMIAAGKLLLRQAGQQANGIISRMNADATSGGFIGATQGGDLLGVPYTAEQIAMRDDLVAARASAEALVTEARTTLGLPASGTSGTNGSSGTGGANGGTGPLSPYDRFKADFVKREAKMQTAADMYLMGQKLIAEGNAETPPDQNKISDGNKLMKAAKRDSRNALAKMRLDAINGGWSRAEPGKIDPSTGQVYTAEKIQLAARLKWFEGVVDKMMDGGTLPNGGTVTYVPPPITPNTPVQAHVAHEEPLAA